jgi:hypothetical protein
MVEHAFLKEGEVKDSKAQGVKDAVEQNQGAQGALIK